MSGSVNSPVVTTLTVDDAEFRRQLQAAAQLLNSYVRTNESASRAIAAQGQATQQATARFTNFRAATQQAGYQLQDFVVQVQAGTSWLTALGQQGSQMLGVFGPAGAIAGVVLTVGLLAAQLLGVASAGDEATNAQKKLDDALEEGIHLLEAAEDRQLRLAQARLKDAQAAGEQIRKEAELRVELAKTNLARLEAVYLQENELLRRSVDPRDAGIVQQNNSLLADARQRLEEAQAGLASANSRVAQLPTMAQVTERYTNQSRARATKVADAAAEEIRRNAETLQNSFDNFWDQAEARSEMRVSKFEDETKRAAEAAIDLEGAGRDFATVFTSAFDGLITKGGTFADVLERLEQGIARVIERLFITKPLEQALSGALGNVDFDDLFSGVGSAIGSGIGDLFSSSSSAPGVGPGGMGYTYFGGPRASGGPVSGGAAYLVGEEGPEMFVPDVSGSIVPNSRLGGSTVYIDARGAEQGVEARIDAVLARRLPAISAVVRGDLTRSVNRGGQDALTFGRRTR